MGDANKRGPKVMSPAELDARRKEAWRSYKAGECISEEELIRRWLGVVTGKRRSLMRRLVEWLAKRLR